MVKAYRPSLTIGDATKERRPQPTDDEGVQHTVPGASAELSADEVQSGGLITVTGAGYQPFSTVTIKIGASTASDTADVDGNFSIEVRVPLAAPGNQLLTIEAPPVATETKLVTIVAEPAAEEDRSIANIFAELIDDGVLLNVLKFDNDTKEYAIYNPAAPELSDDFEVNQFDSVWVEVSTASTWLGAPLSQGWNNVAARR